MKYTFRRMAKDILGAGLKFLCFVVISASVLILFRDPIVRALEAKLSQISSIGDRPADYDDMWGPKLDYDRK